MYDISPLACWHLSANKLCLPAFWQVSKLYEVVPPILLAGGKVSHGCTALNRFFLRAQVSVGWKRYKNTFYIVQYLCWISLHVLWQVKNPWPNVDAHSGVLLQYYGLKEQKWDSPPFAPLLPHLAFKGDIMELIQPDVFTLSTPNQKFGWMNRNLYYNFGFFGSLWCFTTLTLFLLHKTSDLVFSTLFIIL